MAAEGWQAEALAKGAFVAGLSEGLALMARTATDGFLVDDEGTPYPSISLDRLVHSGQEGSAERYVPASMEGSPA